ncbi:gamma-tubulin complex component 3 -like protein [Brachionus plicatilis]|uniref:Gamma-tubulin complex component 3-like protein n=1 Tax=Brachionus plicatilis TaxID=10195 RepID=A0A3M7Q7P3_BRAPC|nr:gamma-tubulin complex component 3 -like protein [Brachionus plicatilis]
MQKTLDSTGKQSNSNNVEQLIFRLLSKIASTYNLNEQVRYKFVKDQFTYVGKLLSYDAYSSSKDTLEIAARIKKKLVSQKKTDIALSFQELEAKFNKQKILKNHAALLEFFFAYYLEQNKYESTSNKNSLNFYSQPFEPPMVNDTVKNDVIEKYSSTEKIHNLFKNESNTDLLRNNQRLKPTFILNETYILRELIYAMQGVDGKLFQKDPKDMQSMVLKVDMERTVRMMVLRYLESGWFYTRLRRFLSTYNNNPSAGLVLQAFCAYISAELKEYHRLLAVLESQLGDKDEGTECSNITLRRLLVWLEQPLERLKFLNIICDAVRDKKGGILLSILFTYSKYGDPNKAALVKSGLAKCAIPIRDMIIEWICDGQIRDIHEEFFVGFNNSIPNERLWHDKYNLRKSQIPSFINEDQAKKILIIGKSINFLRVICNEHKQIRALATIPEIESMLDQKSDSQFQELIDNAYADTSSYLIEILLKKYKLLDHFNSLRRYILLGQGDFIRHLMDLMECELNKPAQDLMFPNLQRLLDKAITETNAQFEPSYIISRLDVRLLPPSPNDMGWDVFSLDYTMDGPLKTVLEVSWKNLSEKLDNSKDMDDVISANEQFLDTIISQLLLDENSKEIAKELRTIFDLIVKMSDLCEQFHKIALGESDARKQFKEKFTEDLDEDQKAAMDNAERKRYHGEVKPKIRNAKNQLSILKNSFSEMVKNLLEALKNHPNESLRFLSFRFNFNEYYY